MGERRAHSTGGATSAIGSEEEGSRVPEMDPDRILGRSTTLDNVDKYAIMHRVNIHARDLRILDPLLSYPSTIMGRERAIVLNLEHLKAIITSDEVLLRDPTDENVIPVVAGLQRRLPTLSQGEGDVKESTGHDGETGEEDESPFEFRALEIALEAICSFLAARTTELETAAYPALDELTSKISSRNLDRVRKLKSAMSRLTARVQKVRDELEQLLDDDNDMADLYLSRKLAVPATPTSASGAANWFPNSPTIASKISRASQASMGTFRGDDENDVEELEMLLEAYFMQIDGTLNKLTTLQEYIDDTEDYINIQLDNHRNQLIQVWILLPDDVFQANDAIFSDIGWNFRHEHTLHMDAGPFIHVQMGGQWHGSVLCSSVRGHHVLRSLQGSRRITRSSNFQPFFLLLEKEIAGDRFSKSI